jgi:hypothetical protein
MSNARDFASRVPVDGALSNRNRIINGNFAVWQRGTSWSVGTYAYKADRFQDQANAAFERSTDAPDGFKYSAKIHSWNGGAHQLTTTLENDGFFYNGQTLTISIWAKATSNITIKLGDIYSTGQNALVGSGSYINITTSWQRYSVTVTLSGYNKTTSTGLVFYPYGNFSDGAVTLSTSDSLWLTGFQVEEGNRATPFEHEPYSVTLQKCQRYYQVGSFNGNAGTDLGDTNPTVSWMPVTAMRAPASMSMRDDNGVPNRYIDTQGNSVGWAYGGLGHRADNTPFTGSYTNSIDTGMFILDIGSASVGASSWMRFFWQADAEL